MSGARYLSEVWVCPEGWDMSRLVGISRGGYPHTPGHGTWATTGYS